MHHMNGDNIVPDTVSVLLDKKFISSSTAQRSNCFCAILGVSKDQWVVGVIQSLINWADSEFSEEEGWFILKMNSGTRRQTPRWAFQFDKMRGIVRQPGLLAVQVLNKQTSHSIPNWHRSTDAQLLFVDAVYVCKGASDCLGSEAFSDVLRGSEQKLERHLHAALIDGLSIISIVGGHPNVEQLVKAILIN